MKFAYREIKIAGAARHEVCERVRRVPRWSYCPLADFPTRSQAVRCTEALNLGLPLADAIADAERMGDNA